MNMVCPRFALRLLARADRFGTREALVGDLLEEFASGRSRLWLYQQLIGLYGVALASQARHHARLSPCVVALALSVVLLGGVSIASVDSVLEAWLGFYLVTGTLSLFAHMMARAQVGDVRL
jgi:uncharacterized membrane protein YoaK (UPF0700 family)